MQVNKTNNIIFLKNVESNIIDEAIVILKENVNMSEKKESKNDIGNIDILKEAELIVNQRVKENDLDFEKYKIDKLEKKLKNLRLLNLLFAIATTLIFIIK